MLNTTQRATARANATGGPGRPARRLRRYSPFTFYAFASPWIAGFLLLTVVPFAYAFALSFTNFDGLSGRWQWIGLSNYSEALHDSDLRHALFRTILYIIVVVPLTTAGALGLALLVKKPAKGVSLYRTIYFLPAVLPVVATALMFRLLFDRDTGLVNAILERLGSSDVFWLNDPTAFFVLVVMVSWSLGVGMMIFLAALQNTPAELMDAAAVDGAGPLRRFAAITLPLLTPVILFQVVVGVIFATQTLVEPLLLAPTSTAVGTGGFAVICRLEHIQDDGRRSSPPFSTQLPPRHGFTLLSYLRDLMSSDPGRYRVIVVLVRPGVIQGFAPAPTEKTMTALVEQGASDLPDWLRRKPVAGVKSEVLIYEFFRPNQNVEPHCVTTQESRLTAVNQLVGAGLWKAAELR
jgi:multiple sugar transport system permease protein